MFTTHRKVAAGDFEPITDGLRGWWQMDEGTGTTSTADSSTSGIDGTLVNSPAWELPGANGSNSALLFNGVDQRVYFGEKNSWDFVHQTGVMTLCVWVKVSDNTVSNSILGNAAATSEEGFNFLTRNDSIGAPFLQQSYSIMITRGTNGTYAVTGASPQGSVGANNVWTHVCCVCNKPVSNLAQLYINGSSVTSTLATGASPGALSTATAPRFLLAGACNNSTPLYMTGGVDDMRIYDRTLDASEILSIYNGTG